MRRFLIAGFIVLLITALGWRLSRDLEAYEKTVFHQPSREARKDPYLAFRRWAVTNGIILEDGSMLQAEEYDIVVYDLQRYDVNAGASTCPEWELKEGTHLCFLLSSAVTNPADAEDCLKKYLNPIGLEVKITPSAWNWSDANPLMRDTRKIGEVTTQESCYFTIRELPAGTDYIRSDNKEGYLFLSIPVTGGRVTLTANPAFLRNDYIAKVDNAELAWRMFSGSGRGQRVLFMVGPSGKSGIAGNPWIRWVLLSWLLALAVLLWSGTKRPDSALAEATATGSDIAGRLAAEGEFLRKHNRTAGYLEAGRLAALRKLRRRGWRDPASQDSLKEIKSTLGVDEADLNLALKGKTSMSPAEYLRVMKIFRKIEAEL